MQFRTKSVAPAAMQKQMQTAIAIGAMTWVYSLDQMKLSQVHQKPFDRYHGNPTPGTAAIVHDCICGTNAFEVLYDKVDGNDGPQMYLKNYFSQQDDDIYSMGTHFTRTGLSTASQRSAVSAGGRQIFNMAQVGLKEGKKALAIELSAYQSNGHLPSGWN